MRFFARMLESKTGVGTLVLLFGNLGLFVLKFLVGYGFNSMAVLADAYNSLFDTFFSVVLLIGLYFASQPPDPSHPLGHSRIKPLIGLFIAIAIFIGGFQIVTSAVQRLMTGTTITFNVLLVIALCISILMKGGMYYVLKNIGQQEANPPITAAAKDSLADILASSVAIGGVLTAPYFWMVDPLMGLVISGWIFKTGFETAQENINYLIGAAPPSSVKNKIVETVLTCEEVKDVHDILVYYAGPKAHVVVHVEISETLSLRKAHTIGEKIEQAILNIKGVDRAFIHFDPVAVG